MKSLINSGFVGTSVARGASCPEKSRRPSLTHAPFGLGIFLFSLLLVSYEAPGASFSRATPLGIARGGHTATLLSNGKLLVAGGQTNGGASSSAAELYDPATGIWAVTSPMNGDR